MAVIRSLLVVNAATASICLRADTENDHRNDVVRQTLVVVFRVEHLPYDPVAVTPTVGGPTARPLAVLAERVPEIRSRLQVVEQFEDGLPGFVVPSVQPREICVSVGD